MSFQSIFVQNIHYSFQVVSNKHEPYICRGPFNSFFGQDMVKSPLPFYSPVRMFHDDLSSFIGLWISFYVLLVLLNIRSVFTPFNQSSFWIPGA